MVQSLDTARAEEARIRAAYAKREESTTSAIPGLTPDINS